MESEFMEDKEKYIRVNYMMIIYHIVIMYGIYQLLSLYDTSIFYIILFLIMWSYISLSLWFNVVYFYKEKIVQVYPFRCTKNKNIYYISEIKTMQYQFHIAHNPEAIILLFKNNARKRIRIDSFFYNRNKSIFEWYKEQNVELDFITTKHNTFDEIKW